MKRGEFFMKAELYKRLFKAIYTEDIVSLKKIAITIIQEERKLGHNIRGCPKRNGQPSLF